MLQNQKRNRTESWFLTVQRQYLADGNQKNNKMCKGKGWGWRILSTFLPAFSCCNAVCSIFQNIETSTASTVPLIFSLYTSYLLSMTIENYHRCFKPMPYGEKKPFEYEVGTYFYDTTCVRQQQNLRQT